MFSLRPLFSFFFFNDTATTEIYTLSLHDALPIWVLPVVLDEADVVLLQVEPQGFERAQVQLQDVVGRGLEHHLELVVVLQDRKSTRLNSSHSQISYAVFCLKKKKKKLQDCIR